MNDIIAYYDILAPVYDEDRFRNTYGQFIDRRERAILDRLKVNTGPKVLDLACGSGRLLSYATHGIDASKEMIRLAKEKHPGKILTVAEAGNIPFPDNSVDTIISFHFFMHLDRGQLQRILTECGRVLKSGGRIVFDIPSQKRRNLAGYQKQGWHGAYSESIAGIRRLTAPMWHTRSITGLLLLPIHRFPKGIRLALGKLDTLLAGAPLKEYSSYLVFELEKR